MKTFNLYFCACFLSFLTILYAKEPTKSDCLERKKAVTLLDTTEDLLSKAEDSLSTCKKDLKSTDQSECGKKPLAYIGISKKLISDVRENFAKCYNGSKVIVKKDDTARDCSEIFASGRKLSGVYEIWLSEPNTVGKKMKVYCDMDTEGDGWTVIQRRGKFPVQLDFFQGFEKYKNGFGNITEEFYFGNENIRVLCYKGCKIRFDIQAYNMLKGFAIYNNFNLATSNYKLHINGYTGNLGDGMKAHNNFSFSTKDQSNTEKAKEHQGGWWYSDDNQSNLNGIYQTGSISVKNVYWQKFSSYQNLVNVEMKVKPM